MLSYYLLKPVKRVTEYPLLVEKLLKHTPPDHPDYFYTKEALDRAKALCEQVSTSQSFVLLECLLLYSLNFNVNVQV